MKPMTAEEMFWRLMLVAFIAGATVGCGIGFIIRNGMQ